MSTDETATFSDRLRQARKHAKLTQKELAERSGLSRIAVTQWEGSNPRYQTVPRRTTLMTLANVLDVTVDWLATGAGQGLPEPEPEPLTLRLDPSLAERLQSIVNHGLLGATVDAVVEHMLRQYLFEFYAGE